MSKFWGELCGVEAFKLIVSPLLVGTKLGVVNSVDLLHSFYHSCYPSIAVSADVFKYMRCHRVIFMTECKLEAALSSPLVTRSSYLSRSELLVRWSCEILRHADSDTFHASK